MDLRIKSFLRLRVAAGIGVLLLVSGPARAQLEPLREDQGATGLGLALRRLPVTGRVLYVTAHPDDENNAALVALSRGRGLATALLTLTRGESGQNAIGAELGEALGVLRTGELLAVHRYDAARQFFSSAYDFGFSFSLEETLAKWGHDETLGDVVRVFREFRPDVILTLPTDAPDHQHHVAAARLAAEAFRAAADPSRFSEQIAEGLLPWQARAIYAGGVGGGNETPEGARTVVLRTGDFDPLLGMTWAEFGSLERTMHKCQSAWQLKVSPGEFAEARYVLVDAEPRLEAPQDVLDGIDNSLPGLRRFAPAPEAGFLDPGLAALDADVRRAADAYDARAPHKTLAPLRQALGALRELTQRVGSSALPVAARHDLLHRLSTEEGNILQALALAHGLVLEAASDDGDVVPGQTFTVTTRAFNGGPEPVRVEGVSLALGPGWTATRVSGEPALLASGQSVTIRYRVTVDAEAPFTQPYWRRNPKRDRYDLLVPADRGRPFSPASIVATLRYVTDGLPAALERSVVFRSEGRWVGGEKQKTVNVVPALSVRLTPEVAVFPASGGAPQKRELRAAVHQASKTAGAATVRLETPAGWTVEPREVALRLAGEGSEGVARFFVTPPAGLKEGETTIAAVATREGVAFRDGYQVIAFDHVEERHHFRPAVARALAVDVRTAPGASIGYVTGVGDEVADALRQIGLPVTLLAADDLGWGDLSRYTTIVLGVRAYQARADLRAYHTRLMRWVEEGGHLVVQYHRGEFNPDPSAPSPWAPFPARVATSYVTDETAPMEILVPDSPAFTSPNRIGPRDWDGWVRERGIQLLEAKDTRYVDLLAAADPFPKNAGRKTGLLVDARVGKGTWTYVGLVLFRELPAGVPGAYRLLANLVSRPRGR